MNFMTGRIGLLAAIVLWGVQLASAAPVKPALPVAGWLYDETYDGFGSTIKDSFGTMNGLTAKGNPTNTAPGPGGPTTAPDAPFAYTGNTSFSTIGGPNTGGSTIWHGTFDVGTYRTRVNGAPAVTVSAWLKYATGALTIDGTNAQRNNANAFMAMTIDGNASSGGSGLYLNLPTGTAPDLSDNTNRLLVGGTSVAADGFLSYTTTGTLVPDQWNHIVGILDYANDQIRVSINGGAFETATIAFGADTLTAGIDGGSPDIIPSRSFRSEYIGLLDEVAIWKTALTLDNVTWLQQNSLHNIRQPGDFDSDGDVDGADFVAWQTNFPKATGALLSEGDADGDWDVDGADFVVWQTNFPFTPTPGTTQVPEPFSWGMLMIGGVMSMFVRRFVPVASHSTARA